VYKVACAGGVRVPSADGPARSILYGEVFWRENHGRTYTRTHIHVSPCYITGIFIYYIITPVGRGAS